MAYETLPGPPFLRNPNPFLQSPGFGSTASDSVYTPLSPTFDDPEPRPSSPQYGAPMQLPPAGAFLENYDRNVPDHNRRRRSMGMDVRDPVALHLLVETAVGDSQSYEILSFAAVEALKKEQIVINARIDGVRRKLALESKVRDAARNLNRLYAGKNLARPPSGSNFKLNRRSRGSSGSSGGDPLMKTDDELASSIKKCDELSAELYRLEVRSRQIEKQLLRHQAGVLQMAYDNMARDNKAWESRARDARPDSPASMDFGKGRMSYDGFDDRSLYQPLNLDGAVDVNPRGLGRRASNVFKRTSSGATANTLLQPVEKRLEDLNDRLRDLIIKANPQRGQTLAAPPKKVADDDSPLAPLVDSQLDFLTRNIDSLEAERASAQKRSIDLQGMAEKTERERLMLQSQLNESKNAANTASRDRQSLQAKNQELERKTKTDLEGLRGRHQSLQTALGSRVQRANAQLYDVLSQDAELANQFSPPGAGPQDLESQLSYLDTGVSSIAMLTSQLTNRMRDVEANSGNRGKVEEYDIVLEGLWQIIISGEEEARQRKREKRRTLAANAEQADELADMSADEEPPPPEDFSLQAFSAKVQWLYGRSQDLKEQQRILRRQVRQQRDVNRKSDMQSRQQIDQSSAQLSNLQQENEVLQTKLAQTVVELGKLNGQVDVAAGSREKVEQELLADVRSREADIKKLEAQVAELRDEARLNAAEVDAAASSAEERLDELSRELEAAQRTTSDAQKALEAKEAELRELESDVVRLTTDLTFAKAELDSAYGSRAERAKDATSAEVTSLKAEIDGARRNEAAARSREQELKKALEETLAEYEDLTKASVEAEREREDLEQAVDAMRDRIETLESQLSDERVKTMGLPSPGLRGMGGDDRRGSAAMREATSSRVLKDEFRRMMRDQRAESTKQLRAEQEERRKLEAMVRNLRRDQTPAKSSLSQSMRA